MLYGENNFKILCEIIRISKIINYLYIMEMTNTQIKDENEQIVDFNYLLNIVEISNSPEDFITKANYGITEEKNLVSLENNDLLREFYILHFDKF